MDSAGRLPYPADAAKNRIVDFSHAGCQAGEQTIPAVPTVSTLGPARGHDTKRVQDALDAVVARAPDSQGFVVPYSSSLDATKCTAACA